MKQLQFFGMLATVIIITILFLFSMTKVSDFASNKVYAKAQSQKETTTNCSSEEIKEFAEKNSYNCFTAKLELEKQAEEEMKNLLLSYIQQETKKGNNPHTHVEDVFAYLTINKEWNIMIQTDFSSHHEKPKAKIIIDNLDDFIKKEIKTPYNVSEILVEGHTAHSLGRLIVK